MRFLKRGNNLKIIKYWKVIATFLVFAFFLVGAKETSLEKQSFDVFNILLNRNIFDPNRGQPQKQQEKPIEPPKKEYLTLLGVVICGGDSVAFFESVPGGLGKQIKVGEEVAGFGVSEMSTDRILLTKSNKIQELFIGWQLTHQGDEGWQIGSKAVQPNDTPSSTSILRASSTSRVRRRN